MKSNNPWLIFVADYRKKHPHLPYSDVLKQAKPEYDKLKKKHGGNPLAFLSSLAQPVSSLFGQIGTAVQNRREKNGFYKREKAEKDAALYKKLRKDPDFKDLSAKEIWNLVRQEQEEKSSSSPSMSVSSSPSSYPSPPSTTSGKGRRRKR